MAERMAEKTSVNEIVVEDKNITYVPMTMEERKKQAAEPLYLKRM